MWCAMRSNFWGVRSRLFAERGRICSGVVAKCAVKMGEQRYYMVWEIGVGDKLMGRIFVCPLISSDHS